MSNQFDISVHESLNRFRRLIASLVITVSRLSARTVNVNAPMASIKDSRMFVDANQ